MTLDNTGKNDKLTLKGSLIVVAISIVYLIVSKILVGFKTEQLGLIALFWSCYFISPTSRKFILGFSIFIVYWLTFDYMKAFPNYRFNLHDVSIEGIYNLEKSIFGITHNGTIVTPNEYWLINHNSFLDVLCGIFYLCWVPVPLIFAGILFFKHREQFFYFALTFLLVNYIGYVIYYIYPAAPPWYVQEYGFVFHSNTPGNSAGLDRFDKFFNINLFQSLYAKSSNVFAAMPSLHSAYPIVVLYYGIKNTFKKYNILFGVIMVGIWFSAVYTSHHYVLDVLMGITCAITGIALFNYLSTKNKMVKGWLQKMLVAVS